jgi:hypothetical protein
VATKHTADAIHESFVSDALGGSSGDPHRHRHNHSGAGDISAMSVASDRRGYTNSLVARSASAASAISAASRISRASSRLDPDARTASATAPSLGPSDPADAIARLRNQIAGIRHAEAGQLLDSLVIDGATALPDVSADARVSLDISRALAATTRNLAYLPETQLIPELGALRESRGAVREALARLKYGNKWRRGAVGNDPGIEGGTHAADRPHVPMLRQIANATPASASADVGVRSFFFFFFFFFFFCILKVPL